MSTVTYPPGWYVIAESREIPRSGPVALERFDTRVAVWRKRDGTLSAVGDRCPHRGASLGLGKVVDDCVACPFHGFRYDSSGACVEAPVLGHQGHIPKALHAPSYPVREDDGWVYLYWGTAPETLPEPESFPRLRTGYRQRTMVREWDASFVRVIENQLDPFHLPFVHKTTIGRNMKPEMRVEHDETPTSVRAWIARNDPGTGNEPYIEFRWPNLWENHISAKFSIVVAFVPVRANRTRAYLRNYQRMVTMPVLSWIFDLLLIPSNNVIFGQDRRVVESQPQLPLLAEGEVLVKADGPIIAFRKMFASACATAEAVPASALAKRARDDAPPT